MKKILPLLFWICLGVIYLSFAGRAHGFVLVGFLGILLIILIIASLVSLIKVICFLCKNQRVNAKNSGYLLLSKLTAVSLVFFAHQINNKAVDESIKIGDELVKIIELYKLTSGNYPESLEGSSFKVYKPSLKNSTFYITPFENDSGFLISFNSVAWLTCSRKNDNPVWICDD